MTDQLLSDEDVWGTPAATPSSNSSGLMSDEDVWGAPAPAKVKKPKDVPPSSLSDYAAEFAKAVPRGVAGTINSMAKGLSIWTSDDAQKVKDVEGFFASPANITGMDDATFKKWSHSIAEYGDLNPITAINYQMAASALRRGDSKAYDEYLGTARKYTDTRPIEDQQLTKQGKALEDATRQGLKENPAFKDSWTTQIGEGLGSTVPFIPIALASGGTGVTLTGGMSGTQQEYDQAKGDIGKGVVPDGVNSPADAERLARRAARMGAVPGASETLPIEFLLDGVVDRIPGLKRIADTPVWGKFLKAAGRMAAQMAVEGGQEGGQQYAQNLVNQLMINKDQDLNEGVLKNALVGAATGGIMQGASELKKAITPAAKPADGKGYLPAPPTPPPDGGGPAGPAGAVPPVGHAPLAPTTKQGMRDLQKANPKLKGVLPEVQEAFANTVSDFGEKINIKSGYRSPEENAKAGGAKDSQHIHKTAIDLQTSGMSKEKRQRLVGVLRSNGFTAIGVYPSGNMHADMRGETAYWGADYTHNSAPKWLAEAMAKPVAQRPPAKNGVMTDHDVWGTGAADATGIEGARQGVNTKPTEGQAKAGNYKKGHTNIHGLDVTIENPVGTDRSGKGPDGAPWTVNMPADYGYIKRTEGADGDQVDVFIGPHHQSDKIFIVDQIDHETGHFDELKVIAGTDNVGQATDLYHRSFSDNKGHDRIGHVTEMTVAEFKKWLADGGGRKPIGLNVKDAWKRDARLKPNSGTYDLASNQTAVSESKKQEISTVRGQGHNDVSGVGEGLHSISDGSGKSSTQGSNAGSDRQQQGLPSGQHEVDNLGGPIDQSTGTPNGGAERRTNDNSTGRTQIRHEEGVGGKSSSDGDSSGNSSKSTTNPSLEKKETHFGGSVLVTEKPKTIAMRHISDDTAITSSGRKIPVKYAVVEASDLTPSQTDEGQPHPTYPAELQPRDRERRVSQTQVHDIATKMEPRLLDKSAKASDGAPIVSDQGIVESGNGRTLGIRRAYERNLPTAQTYREHLAKQGYPVDGMKQPVLVRVRQGEMTPEERQAFTRESNDRDTLGMSAPERAMADATAMTDKVLSLYRGGEIDEAGNRDFVKAFMQHVASKNDAATMVDSDGRISQEAVRRINASLLAKAYGDAELVASLTESTDINIKSIGGALTDVAGSWTQMVSEAKEGKISRETNQTKALLEAVRMVDRSRREDKPLSSLVGQKDIFSGKTLDPMTEAFLRLMFRDDANWRQPMGRKAMADTLQFYIGEARKTQAGVDLLGETPAKSGDILNAAKRKQGDGQQDTEQDTLDLTKPKAAETSSKPAGENAGSPSGAGEGKPVEVAQEAARKPAAETGAVKKDENSSTDGGTKSVRSAENVAETSAPAVETAAGRSDNQTNPPGQGNDSPQDEGSGKQEKLILGNTLQQRQQQQATKPFRQWLSLAAQGFGYKIVDTGLPFGAKDHWGHFHSFGTQLIDRLLPGDKLHLALDKMTVATPAMRAYIKEHMSAPWFHRVWFGHDPLANLGMVIDKFGVEALPDWAFGLLKDSMSKAGIPLPGVQWLVQGGLVSDKFATEWLSLNVGEALSGGLSILGTYRLYKKMKNGQQIHRGWAVAGILFKTVGGVLSSNPVLLMSAAADTVILMKAGNAAEVKAGLSKAEELRRADPFGDPPIMGNTGTAAPAFFSALGRAVEAMKQEKAPASQWMGMIKNTQGVKAEEVAWLGLEDWLNAQQGSITKKQITDFIRENQVQVQDVVKGYLTDEMVREALDLSKEFWDTASQADQKGWREEAAQYEGHGSSTKFQSYQVPGGENYRELLLTLPQKRETLPQGTTYGPNGEILDSVGSPVSRASIERMMPEQGFKSSHFDEPNILAHVRFNDRVVDGKKVLFLEEVQSDYAQAKRRGKDVPDAPFINNTSDWASLALKRMIRYASENGYYSISWTTGDVQAERYDLSKQIDRIEYTKRADGTYNLSAEKGTTPLIVEAKIDLNRISDLVGKEIADKIQKGEGKTTGTFEGNVTAELTGLDLKVGGDGMRGFYDKILVDAANKLGKKFGAKVGQADIGAAQEWGLKDSHGWAIGDRFNSEVEAEAYRTRHTSLHDTRVVVDGALSVHSLPITQSMRDSVMQGQPLFNQGDNRLPTTSFIVTKAQISAARDEVMAITNKILGHTISVNVVDRLPSPMPAEFIAAYDQRDQSIWISMKAAKDFANNAGHESLHALRHIGAITPIEWTALVAVAKKNGYSLLDDPQRSAIYRREYVGRFNRTEAQFQDMLDEEAVADMFGDYVSARSKATPFVQKIMDKISEWVEAMVNLMQGHGIETGRGAMRKAYSGEMAQRPGLNVRPQAIGTLGNTDTAAFKRWFGDSKVVDENGKPLVVYHGTQAASDFERFNLRTGDVGVHFGTAGQANDRIEYKASGNRMPGGDPRIVPVYLSIKNPLRMTDAGAWNADNMLFQLKNTFGSTIESLLKGKSIYNSRGISTKDIREFIQRQGYDGIVYRNTGEVDGGKPYADAASAARQKATESQRARGKSLNSFDLEDQSTPEYQASSDADKAYRDYREANAQDSYIAFSPTQIKSIHNRGTFNSGNPSILGNAERNSPEVGAGGFADPFGDELKAADAEDFAGNINLKKLNTTDDIKDLLRKVSNEMGGFIAERRGVRSHQMTKDLAFEMGMTEAELLKRQTGDAWNAESLEAARMILLKSAESVLAMAETAKTTDSLSVLAEVIKKYNRHRAIQEQVAGLKAEAGRSLNILKTMVGVDPLQRIDAVLSGVKGRKTSFGAKVKGDEAMARELVDMITGLGDPAQISNFIAQSYKITIWDKIRELWINMLLSGPRTHATNILSNTLTALWQVPETAVAATIGAFHGGEKVQAAEATARLVGIIEGAKEGAIAAAHVLKTGEPPDVISKIEQHQQKAIGGMTGTIVRIPGVLLQAEDQVFKAMSYRAEINALAVRMAISEGRTGKGLAARIAELRANPSMKMKSAAHEAALYNTFQNKLGPIGQMIQNLREAIPGAWIILPFLRTPANIIKYAAERTPFGLAMKPVRDNLRGLNGNVARDTQLARLALGTALMAATVSLVAAGMVSGSGPDDPDEKNMLRETGWQPYSIKIGGKWYSYQRLDPLAFVIGITADMFHLGSELPDYQADKIASLIIGSITNNVLDKTWLSGLSDFINAIQEPGRFGAGYVRRLAGSAVPALVAQTAQVIDPNLREARTIVDTIKSRVPYMSQSLLPRRNVFGEEIKRQGALGPDILSPIFTSQVKDNPAAAEMLALKYYPSMPTRDVNGHRLSSEQYDRYAELAGKLATEQVNKIIATDTWNNRSDDKKIDKIKDIFEEARRIARVKLKQEWQELAQKVKKQKG